MTSSPLDGMTAVVAGAGPGIGTACAARSARRAPTSSWPPATPDRLDALAAEMAQADRLAGTQVVPLAFDFADLPRAGPWSTSTLDRLGRIDVLVNVATAGGDHTPIDEADWESWRRAFEVNVIGTMELSRLAARAMRRASPAAAPSSQIGTIGHAGAPAGPGPLHGDQAGDGHGLPDPGQGARARPTSGSTW